MQLHRCYILEQSGLAALWEADVISREWSATCPQMNVLACVNNPMGWKEPKPANRG